MNLLAFRLTQAPFSAPLMALLFIACALLSLPSYAQNEGRSYQVEVLIFKRNPLLVNTDEIWRKDLKLSYPANTRYISRIQPKGTHQLGGHDYTLRKDENHTVLFHQSWRQKMWGKNRSPSLIIRGGQAFGNHRELEGSIKIHIGRYLHVSTDLWLSEFAFNEDDNQNTQDETFSGSINTLSWPRLPSLPNADNSQAYQYIFDNGPKPSRIITLREKRRMRSKETHYIDHPYMGILVRMLPIK